MKGFNHIDFAVAVFLIIMVVGISVSYVTNYLSGTLSPKKIEELKLSVKNLEKAIFESSGIPENWEEYNFTPVRIGLKENIHKSIILINETYEINRTNEIIDVHILFDINCLNKTHKKGIFVYDNFLNKSPTQIYNETYCYSEFLKEANVLFLVNQTSGEESEYNILYSDKNLTEHQNILYLMDNFDIYNETRWGSQPSWATIENGILFIEGGTLTSQEDFIFKTLEFYANISTPSRGIGFSNGNNYVLFSVDTSNNLRTNQSDGTETSEIISINPNQWHLYKIEWNSSSVRYYVDDSLKKEFATNVPNTNLPILFYNDNTGNMSINWIKVWENNTYTNNSSPLEIKTVSDSTITALSLLKLNAAKNLSYNDIKNSLGIKKQFNITVCEYSFGTSIPSKANIISSNYPVILLGGKIKYCLASIKVW